MQLLRDPGEPAFGRKSVGAEFLGQDLLFTVENCKLHAQLTGGGALHQVAGIGGAHLEQDTQVEVAHGLAFQPA